MKAVIIEDEEAARKSLKYLLKEYCPNVEVIGEADDVKASVSLLQKAKPDLVFLDIRLTSGTSFEILEQLPELSSKIIFTTAYNEYAIKAFRYSAIDYLLKPLNPDELKDAVEKASKNSDDKLIGEKLQLFISTFKSSSSDLGKIALPTLNGFQIEDLKKILRIEADRNYCKVFLTTGEILFICRTLKEMEELLNDKNFMRIHLSHLVNLSYIKNYFRGRGGTVELTDGTKLEVSRSKKDELLERFKFN